MLGVVIAFNPERTEGSFVALAPYNQAEANFDFRGELPQEDYPYKMTQVPKDIVMTWGCIWKVVSHCHCSIGIPRVRRNPKSSWVHCSIRFMVLELRPPCCCLDSHFLCLRDRQPSM